ncbi:hypothetical protein K440DRAFT_636165 [Wilcoxina mikolae CBS 423.85]|nr:hypothetical protein K440DRAFT_636165 [Wilcoxina mikolae CBS 423.85]
MSQPFSKSTEEQKLKSYHKLEQKYLNSSPSATSVNQDGTPLSWRKSLEQAEIPPDELKSHDEVIAADECNLTLKVYRQSSNGYLSHRLKIYRPDRPGKVDKDINSDEKLFTAMKNAYLQYLLGNGRRFFSMKTLKKIIVRSYTSSTRPVTIPFDEEFLREVLSLFKDPSKVESKNEWINWVFKLKLGKTGRKHILVFEEGWDGTRVAIAGSLPFVGSFLVAIIWC